MPDFFVIAVNSDGVEQKLTEDETVIGRKSFFTCNDHRISRTHGLIIRNTEEATITLRSTHSNPIFFKTSELDKVQVLQKEGEVTLSNEDQFGLLKDEFWYRLSIRNGGQIQLRVRTLNELNSDIPNVPTKRIVPEVATTQDIDSTEPNPKRLCQGNSSEAAAAALPDEDAHGEATPAPREPTPEPGIVPEPIPIPAVLESAQIPDEPQPPPLPDAPSSSSLPGPSNPTVAIKKEIKTEVKTEEADSSVYRESCQFGVRCYRRNLEHRREVAHPGDTDYRRPNFPPAPSDAPPCPYAASCYRRNPQHFVEYSHPDSSVYIPQTTVNPPVGVLPPRLPYIRPLPLHDDDDDDDEDMEGSDDDEMDDFIASDDDDEDFVADGAMSGGSDDEIDDAELDDDELEDGEANEE